MSIELDIVAEFLEAYGQAGDVSDALDRALPRLVDHVGCEAGSFFFADPVSRELVCQACVGPVDIHGIRVPFGSGIVGRVYETQEVDTVEHADSDKDHRKSVDEETGFVTRNVLTLPVTFKDSRIGALQLLNRSTAENDSAVFPEQFISVSRALASGLALGYHSAEITEQVRANDALLRDVELAGTVQSALIPEVPEELGFVADLIPYTKLSGDFYDFVVADNKTYIIVGDVSGKGVAASLTMAQAQAAFRIFARAGHRVDDVGRLMNRELARDLGVARFVTAFIGVFDHGDEVFQFVNLGHGEIVCESAGTTEIYLSSTPPLGITAPENFFPDVEEIALGDWRLWVVTDGITEAEFKGQEFGVSGLLAIVDRLKDEPLRHAVTSTLDLVTTEKLTVADDVTVAVINGRGRGA